VAEQIREEALTVSDFRKGQVAIVGIGEVPTGIYADRPCLESSLRSARQAILDSGLDKDEIDVVIPAGTFFDAWFNTNLIFSRLVEELGLTGRASMNLQVVAGGASSSALLETAAGLICTGKAKAVLCVHSEKWGSMPSQEMIDKLATFGISEEWEAPYGLSMNAVAALITQRHMYEIGTTAEQIASVCVALRKWAELNPNAMYRKPLTIEDVLRSKMVASPLHAFECNRLADGGSAFIVTNRDRARALNKPVAYLLGSGSVVTHYAVSQERNLATLGYAEAANEAFGAAGIGPKDIDVVEIYDSYPVFNLIALEGSGFCERGTAGRFVMEGNTWPGGVLPMTTNGGMLSQGHTGTGGGIAVLVEAARQLLGEAGQRQVQGARFAVETATGGTYMDSHVTVLGTEVP
jgi:acetyl-CoA acetyltransferase